MTDNVLADAAIENYEVIRFLTDRLNDEDRVAQEATRGPWKVVDRGEGGAELVSTNATVHDSRRPILVDGSVVRRNVDADHMALHDPSKTLARVEATRAVLVEAGYWVGWLASGQQMRPEVAGKCEMAVTMVRGLAAGYRWHPQWRDTWAPRRGTGVR